MPLDKKNQPFIDQLQSAYALDENIVESLANNFPLWSGQYQKIYPSLFLQIKKAKENSKSLQSSLVHLKNELQLRLSDQLTENDLLSILTDALMTSFILSDEIWHTCIEKAYLSNLDAAIQALRNQNPSSSPIQELIKLKEEISTVFPDELYQPIWQLLHDQKRYKKAKVLFTSQGTSQLIVYINYLLKRKLGQSLNDADTKILWIDTTENHWMENLLNHIEPDLQKKASKERIVSCKIDFFDFALNFQSTHNFQAAFRNFPVFWQDPLNVPGQGIQTSLFSPVDEENTIVRRIRGINFSLISLDLRQPIHPYRYARKVMKQIDQQINNIYQSIDIQGVSIDPKERMIFWSMEKLNEQGVMMAILPLNILEDKENLSFRRFLEFLFQEIYVLDLYGDHPDGIAVVYLIKKTVDKKALSGKIQYARFAFKDFNAGNANSFDELPWQKIHVEHQNYWIGLPESDFFELYPLFGTTQAIFTKKATGLETFMDHWLMDDDPKLLAKKVKHLLKLYTKDVNKEERLSTGIKWPQALQKLARAGITLSFDKQKIKRILLKPFVYTYIYAEKKLLKHADAAIPTIAYDSRFTQLYALNQLWHNKFFEHLYAFPLYQNSGVDKPLLNISDAALHHFQAHYKLQTKELDQTFIVFPPENISSVLDKIESVSRDLPVIRKYPNQINRLLEEARYFTSDVELLTPPYEKIDEFKRKVLRLEKDAIERKVIYQRVKTYIDELKEQLAGLTREHDEAQKDYEAVSKENIFYYTFAVLHDPNYREKYRSFLQRELPRIPMYPKFRQWANWGKTIFQAHLVKEASEGLSHELQCKVEKKDKLVSKSFSYQLDEEQEVIELQERNYLSIISNIPEKAWNYQFEGKSPFAYYLDHLSHKPSTSKKNNAVFDQPTLEERLQIFEHLKLICSISMQLSSVQEEVEKTVS